MKLQLKRSNVLDGGSAKEPTAVQMEYGELAVNYNNGDPAIFLKDSNDNIIRIAGAGALGDVTLPEAGSGPHQPGTSDDRYVEVTGDTMTGQLTLPGGGAAAQALQKQEIEALPVSTFNNDSEYITLGEVPTPNLTPYLEKAGDTMTGDLTFANTANVIINEPFGSISPNSTVVYFNADSTTGIRDGLAPLDSAYITAFGAYRSQDDQNANIRLSKSSAVTTSSSDGERGFILIKRDDDLVGSCELEEYLTGSGWFDDQVTWKGNLHGALVKSKKIWNQRPSQFWTEGDYIGIGNSTGVTSKIYGSVCSTGSFGVSLCSNGYRNDAGGWTSYSSNTSQTGGAEISLRPNGQIIFHTDTTKNGVDPSPTQRAKINDNGLTVNILSGTGNRAVYSNSSGNLTNSSSDVTLKTNVQTLDSQVNIVKALNPVSYNWIDTNLRGVQPEIGFIAQEVQELVPEVVGTNHDGTLSVDYPKMVATLTSALQEALTRIEALEAEVTSLKGTSTTDIKR